jgi:cell division protein YceG involved in septum cleavage
MRAFILTAAVLINMSTSAQNNTAANIIEGGKALVELVRIFKMPRYLLPLPQPVAEKKDSCSIKNVSDFTIKNSSGKTLLVSLYRRNGNIYEPGILSLKILPKNQETLYELKAGIYKMKFETEEDDEIKVFREGEIKLNPCENIFKEIKNDGL